jgi:hypothetical protein
MNKDTQQIFSFHDAKHFLADLSIVPNIYLWLRSLVAKNQNDKRELVIGDFKKYFELRGYNCYTIFSPNDNNPHTGKIPLSLITKRTDLSPGDRIVVYRLSNTFYLEEEE